MQGFISSTQVEDCNVLPLLIDDRVCFRNFMKDSLVLQNSRSFFGDKQNKFFYFETKFEMVIFKTDCSEAEKLFICIGSS